MPGYSLLRVAWPEEKKIDDCVSLLGYRMGRSAPQVVCGGMISDLFVPENRGQATSVHSIAPLFELVVGPIAGGLIVQHTTWRWIFYSIAICCGIVQVALMAFLRGCYVPVILLWREHRVIKETGSTRHYINVDYLEHSSLRAIFVADKTIPDPCHATYYPTTDIISSTSVWYELPYAIELPYVVG